ncbi:hypothetical protein MMS57_28230, partial [Escherichia coli]|nr:hypothetical protein [Escherichia coli]
ASDERVSYRISTIINPRRPVETRPPPTTGQQNRTALNMTCAFLVSEKLSAVDCRSRDPETRLKRFRVRQNKKND